MKMSVLPNSLSADSCEVEVITAGGSIYLHFIRFPSGARCTARSTFVKGLSTKIHDLNDFKKACRLASEAMNKVNWKQVSPEKGDSVSNRSIAHAILKNKNLLEERWSIQTALDSYFETAGEWLDPNRKSEVWKEIGKIGGAASTQRRVQRQKRKELAKQKARQGEFKFT